MDIYSYLRKDHRKVADLMEQVIANPNDREELFAEIKHELSLHAETEEATFYKAVEHASRSQTVGEKMEHAEEEHDEIRMYLDRLTKLPIDSEDWIEQFGEFKHAVTHHVDEEESEVFEKARKYLSHKKAKDLAIEMDTLKQKKLGRKAAA